MMGFILALLVQNTAVSATAAAPAPETEPAPVGMIFHGGPLDGLKSGELVAKDGRKVPALVLTDAQAPVPTDAVAVVRGFTAATEQGRYDMYSKFAWPSAELYLGCMESCKPKGLLTQQTGAGFTDRCKAGDPYFLGSKPDWGEDVRVPWLCNNELWYLSFVRVLHGKIAGVSTMLAVPPRIHKSK